MKGTSGQMSIDDFNAPNALKPGKLKSLKMTSYLWLRSNEVNSFFFAAQSILRTNPASVSKSRMISTARGESSRHKTLNGIFFKVSYFIVLRPFWRQFTANRPQGTNLFHPHQHNLGNLLLLIVRQRKIECCPLLQFGFSPCAPLMP